MSIELCSNGPTGLNTKHALIFEMINGPWQEYVITFNGLLWDVFTDTCPGYLLLVPMYSNEVRKNILYKELLHRNFNSITLSVSCLSIKNRCGLTKSGGDINVFIICSCDGLLFTGAKVLPEQLLFAWHLFKLFFSKVPAILFRSQFLEYF